MRVKVREHEHLVVGEVEHGPGTELDIPDADVGQAVESGTVEIVVAEAAPDGADGGKSADKSVAANAADVEQKDAAADESAPIVAAAADVEPPPVSEASTPSPRSRKRASTTAGGAKGGAETDAKT
ncbi:MAG TPA: hypothetical protein VMX57_03935 [Planctomycetota bacterium]|nr:hypothetical protein [Planctomycetota bacterium]